MTDEERKEIEQCILAVRRRNYEIEEFLEAIERVLQPPPDLNNAVAEGEEDVA